MPTIFTIAHREYTAMIATKAFLITLVLMPVMMLGGIIIMPWANKIEGARDRRIVVADPDGRLFAALQQAAEARNATIKPPSDDDQEMIMDMSENAADRYLVEAAEQGELSLEQRLKYSDEIRDGSLFALVEIPAMLMDGETNGELQRVKFVSSSGTLSEVRGWVAGVLSNATRQYRLQKAGIDPAVVSAADVPVNVAAMRPYERSTTGDTKEGQSEEESVATIFAPFLMMMLMFVVIFLAAQPMLESSMEEKTHRISEVLLGTVTPTQMMAGKLLGNVAGSMVIFVIYGIGGFFLLKQFDMLSLLPTHLIGWFLVFQILAVLLYSSVFMTVGAAVSQLKEAQSLLLPVWLVLAAPMMIWLVALKDPNGIVATTMSFFPPSAPLMMTLRLGTGTTIPAWQPPLAALLLIVTVVIVVLIAGRIYRVSLLRTDGVGSIVQFLRRAT